MLLSFCLAAGTGHAAQADADRERSPAETQGKNWFGKELSRFKSYPHLDMAYRAVREGRQEDAVQEFQAYLRLKPDDAKARSDFMNLLFAMRRDDAALAEARRILAVAPDDPAALLTSGLCLLRAGDLAAAVEPLQKAAALSGSDAVRRRVAVLAAVDALAGLGRWPQALSLLDGLPQAQGDYAAQQARGMVLAKSGDNAGARAAFESALVAAATDKEKLDALRALGVASAALGEADKARRYLAAARDLAPDDLAVLRQLAVLAEQAGNHQEAAALGRKLVKAAPTAENREFLANVLAGLKDYDAAMSELLSLRQDNPGPDQAFRLDMRLGALAMDAGRPEQAVAFFREAVALRRDPLALVRLSRAEQAAGKTGEAARVLEEAVARNADPDQVLELATLLDRLGNDAAALEHLDKALAQPQSPEQRLRTLSMKATLLGEKGDFAAARRALEEALKAPGPDKARLLAALGETCLRQGEYQAAVAAFGQAVAAGAGEEAERSLAEALVKDGRPEQAVGIYEGLAAKAATPEQRAAAKLGLANLLARLGRNAAAAKLYKELAEAGQRQLLLQAGQGFAAAREDAKAVAALAVAANEAASANDRAEALLALGNVYARQRNQAKAYEAFTEAMPLASGLPRDKRAAIALGRGLAAVQSGQPAKAVEPLTQAIALLDSGAGIAKASMALAQAYAATGDAKKAAIAWKRAADTPGALRGDVATAYESLGYALAAAGDTAGAEAALRRALAGSAARWRVLAALGQVAYKAGRYQEALDEFQRSLELHPDLDTRLAIGRAYDKLGKPGLALVAYGEAAPDVAALPPDRQREFHLAVGFLYAAEYRYDAAVAAFQAALERGYDPATAVRLGRLERLAGRPGDAERTLTAVDPAQLPTDLQILRLSELASLAEAGQDFQGAVTYLEASLAIAPSADAAFRLGNALRDLNRPREAVAAYRQAVALDDGNRYLTALGYALEATRQYKEAAGVFETVVGRDPDYLSLWEDLGYAYMHECDNKKAVDRFKRAIDNAPLRPVDTQADREKRDKDVERLRKEVTKLETHFTTTAYMSYIAGEAGALPPSGGEAADTIRSGAGVEFAWIPPVIGFRDDRIFQVIGRISANFNKDTLQTDDRSWQGAVGLRYKPFKTQNLNVGFERLFRIGQEAEENWLLRGMYSWTDGYDVKRGERWWNYTFFYGEYDYYMENDRRSMFYVEGRQGLTFNVGDRFLVTPHLVADFRGWTPDVNQASAIEGGGGLSFKYLFNRADYEVERSSLEVLLQYKYGTLFNKTDVKDRENVINALFLTTILKF